MTTKQIMTAEAKQARDRTHGEMMAMVESGRIDPARFGELGAILDYYNGLLAKLGVIPGMDERIEFSEEEGA